MKPITRLILIFTSILFFLQLGCSHYPVLQEPDIQKFKQIVSSELLRDSLLNGKLTVRMPRNVVTKLFGNYDSGSKEVTIPVATLGGKQRLEERGWNRKYVDPNINVFLNRYETSEGRLFVWYQRPDFYRMDVFSSRYLLCFLWRYSLLLSN